MDKLQRVKINDGTSISERPGIQYPPCDYCKAELDYMPWHGSGLINGDESRHIHACNDCRPLLPCAYRPVAAKQPDTVAVPRELLERLAGSPDSDPDCCAAYYRQQLRALLVNK